MSTGGPRSRRVVSGVVPLQRAAGQVAELLEKRQLLALTMPQLDSLWLNLTSQQKQLVAITEYNDPAFAQLTAQLP